MIELMLKNIGKFEEVNVVLEGITIIAGENNTGKSTIGKTLFSIIKAYQEAEELAYRDKKEGESILDEILNKLIELQIKSPDSSQKLIRLIKKIIKIKDNPNIKALENIKRELISLSLYIKKAKIRNKEILIKKLNSLIKDLDKEIRNISLTENYLEKGFHFLIKKNFNMEINRFNYESGRLEKAKIILKEKNKEIFNITLDVKADKYIKFEKHEEPYIKEITYIETPLILNRSKLFSALNELRDYQKKQMDIPYIEEDLMKKLKYPFIDIDNVENEKKVREFLNEIEKIISGKFKVNENDTNIYFLETSEKQKKSRKFSPINVASGIKAFGIIYLLLTNNRLKDNKHILIFDEPEVHLHPKWQIKYAHILVKLNKYFGCPILINSHSPYFIEAVKYFGNKEKTIDKIHFYRTYVENDVSKIELADENLDKIFNSLVEPLEDLPIWL
jgi:predicted ATPase